MSLPSETAQRVTPGTARVPRVGAPTSLTQRVLEAMITAIREGSFAGGRLPPEDQLATSLGVSRTTVRRALQSLEQIGVIERRPGRGTRLRAHTTTSLLALHGLVPFPTLLRELGHEVTAQTSWTRSDVEAPDLAAALGRPVDGPVYEVRVVLLADDQPAVAMRERFPADVLAREPDDGDMQAGSILFVSARCFRDKIDHAVADLEPCVSSGRDGPHGLRLPKGAPYLALHETFYSEEEEALAFSDVSVNPQLVSFSVFRRFF
ncbi:MAG TPA: GntR family transcriptional regulator [Conexibacter sp.]|jgi:DNA-binding GntR family transcriptional regulator|nr:GntR family transcriptional regulator [Conexibacter sp.]